jgi:hypothetical protein
MSFQGISDVVPYLETAYDTEIDIEAEQKYLPRYESITDLKTIRSMIRHP